MTVGPALRRRPLSFSRRLALTIAVVAILPLIVFGLFVTGRVEASLVAVGDDRMRDALAAVDAVLARRQSTLDEATAAYATWPVTADLVAAGDVDTLREDILAFVERRGDADLAIAVVDGTIVTTGADADAALLAAIDQGASAPPGRPAPRPRAGPGIGAAHRAARHGR